MERITVEMDKETAEAVARVLCEGCEWAPHENQKKAEGFLQELSRCSAQ